jgi:hypothetical protein
MLGLEQARQVSASGKSGDVMTRQAKREQIAFQELSARSEWKAKRGGRRNQPRELVFYWCVESVEALEDEAIAVQRELWFEQVQPSLECLVLVRGFAAQPQMQRCVYETFRLAFATEITGVSWAKHELRRREAFVGVD